MQEKSSFYLRTCIFFCNFAANSRIIMNEHLSRAQIKWVRSLQQKKTRDELGLFVAEGDKCINDLKEAFEIVLLITPENATSMEIAQMSSLRTPQGTIAVFKKNATCPISIGDSQLILALDGVQDPGNLGTIIRTCDWFGIHDIICSRDTADCYNPKVVQATMGALARVHCHYVDSLADILTAYHTQGLPTYGTLLEGTNMYNKDSIPMKDKGIIVMGNEGNGISQSVRPLITHPLLIPSFPADAPTSESLNVSIATAIVLSEFRRTEN